MPEYYTTHSVVAELKDGRVIAKAAYTEVKASGTVNVVVRIPDLREVESILDVKFSSNPDISISHDMDHKITGNVVGFTVYTLSAGTTLTSEVIAIGPP